MLVQLVCLAIKLVLLVFAFVASYLVWRYINLRWLSRRVKITRKKGILITGATSGIGLLLAKRFYQLGFTIFAAYYNDKEPGYLELLNLDCSKTPRIFLIKMDVRSQESIKASRVELEALLEKYNIELYCLINNAGIGKVGPFEWTDRKSIRDSIETNIIGLMWVTREFLYSIIRCRGRVINVSSGLAMAPMRGITCYGSSKSCVAYFSESLHRDIERYGAASYCVLPGNFITGSNILFARLKAIEDSRNSLTEAESEAYRDSIEEEAQLSREMLMERIELGDESQWSQFVKINKINLADYGLDSRGRKTNGPTTTTNKLTWLQQLLVDLVSKADGGADKLDAECGILEAYEHAICLERPPARNYAGNPIYTHLTGPLLEFSSPISRTIIGGLIQKRITKT